MTFSTTKMKTSMTQKNNFLNFHFSFVCNLNCEYFTKFK